MLTVNLLLLVLVLVLVLVLLLRFFTPHGNTRKRKPAAAPQPPPFSPHKQFVAHCPSSPPPQLISHTPSPSPFNHALSPDPSFPCIRLVCRQSRSPPPSRSSMPCLPLPLKRHPVSGPPVLSSCFPACRAAAACLDRLGTPLPLVSSHLGSV